MTASTPYALFVEGGGSRAGREGSARAAGVVRRSPGNTLVALDGNAQSRMRLDLVLLLNCLVFARIENVTLHALPHDHSESTALPHHVQDQLQ